MVLNLQSEGQKDTAFYQVFYFYGNWHRLAGGHW